MTWIIGSKRACLLCCSCLIAIASCAGSGQRVTVRVIDGKPQPTRYVSPGAYEHYLRAELARRDGHAAMAAEELEKALTFDPYAPLLHTRLAATYAQLDRHTQAYEHLHRALELKRDFPDALMVRGDLYAKDEKAVPARLSYERCLSVDPHNVGCHLRLAAWHDRNGDTAGARRLLRQLIERTQGEHGRRQLVQLCLRDLDLGCAAKQLEAARLADPRPATLWQAAAVAQADGRPADAVALLWQLHRRDRANLDVANRLLGLLRQLGDDAQIEALVDSLDRWANSTQRRVTVARLLVHHDLNQQALSMTNGYARQGGDADADARLVRAVALWQMGQRQQASEALALVKRGRPASAGPSVPVVAWAAETLIGQGALGPADALIAAATTTTPDDPSLQLVRAHSLAARGDHAQAVRICNKAAEAAPGNLAVQIDLAIALDRAGRWQEAVARAEAVLRDHPAHVDAINLIGYVLADRNHDLQRAGKMIRVARQLAPLRPDIIDSQGWLSFRRGELTQARRALVIAHRFTPDDPVVLVHLAEVDAALGHGHEAIAGFQHALRLCRDPAQCARWRGRLRALRHAGPPDAATKDSSR